MKSIQQEYINDLRNTLEYAEALVLLERQRKLAVYRKTIKQQLSALQRLSKAAVAAARNDINSHPE